MMPFDHLLIIRLHVQQVETVVDQTYQQHTKYGPDDAARAARETCPANATAAAMASSSYPMPAFG